MGDPNSALWPSAVVPSDDHSGPSGAATDFVPPTTPPANADEAQETPFSTFTSPSASKPVPTDDQPDVA